MQLGSSGPAANPVTPVGSPATIGTPGNPVIGTVIGAPARPAAARREAAASVDELLDLMEDYEYRQDYEQNDRQDYPQDYPPQGDYSPPPSAPALVKAAQAAWLARQDGPSSPAGRRPRRSRPQLQPAPAASDRSRRRGEVYGEGYGEVYGEGYGEVYGEGREQIAPPSAPAMVEAAKAAWLARQDAPSVAVEPGGRPQRSRTQPLPRPQPAPSGGRRRREEAPSSERFRDPASLRGDAPSSRQRPPPQRPPPQQQPPQRAQQPLSTAQPPLVARPTSLVAPPTLQAEAVKAARWLAMQVAPSPRQARARGAAPSEEARIGLKRRRRQRADDWTDGP